MEKSNVEHASAINTTFSKCEPLEWTGSGSTGRLDFDFGVCWWRIDFAEVFVIYVLKHIGSFKLTMKYCSFFEKNCELCVIFVFVASNVING